MFFMDQCAGSHSGHMANIPNNPTLFGLCLAHGATTHSGHPNRAQFARFLKEIADRLAKDDSF